MVLIILRLVLIQAKEVMVLTRHHEALVVAVLVDFIVTTSLDAIVANYLAFHKVRH
jgi:hypothetical protein